MNLSRLSLLAVLAASVLGLTEAPPARAAIVERVVAIVGDRPILLSELQQRARPHLTRVAVGRLDAAREAAAESQIYQELLARMIDERLEEAVAQKANVTVRPEEIDAALAAVAARVGLEVTSLLAEATHQGLSPQEYRDELRRQLLEGKLLALRVGGRSHVTEADARNAYARWLKELPPDVQRPAFEDVRAEMNERAAQESYMQQRRQWLDQLRRGVNIDVRL